MLKVLTEDERKLLQKHFWQVVNNDPILRNFSKRDRTVFVTRMIEVEVARMNEVEGPPFPPEGYEFTWHPKASRLGQPSLQYGSDARPLETNPSERVY